MTIIAVFPDPPTAGVGYTPQTSQPSLSISYDLSLTPGVFSCSSDGYPVPSLTWLFNGGPLPDNLVQSHVKFSDGSSYLQLQWRIDLSAKHMGAYMCVAQNELNTSTAVLNIIVTGTILNMLYVLRCGL